MVRRHGKSADRILLQLVLGIFLLADCKIGAMAADNEQDFYRNPQIRLVVGSTPGSAYDFFARTIPCVMGRQVPGNPAIVVRSMPAAGGLTVSNFMCIRAPRVGAAICATTHSMPIASRLAA